MDKNKKDTQDLRRVKKITITLGLIFIALAILVNSILNTIEKNRKLPSLSTTKQDIALRGDILSKDNFKIATSKKIYTATINTKSLDTNKKNLFVKLFSIYSDIDSKELLQKINKSLKNPGFLILSRKISSRDAKNLKLLAYKLQKLKVFKAINVHGSRIVYGLDLYETGESRLYPYKDTLTPVIGYVSKRDNNNGKLRVKAIKGLEKQYNTQLNNMRNGILKGERDILSYVIFNKDSIIKTRKDGDDIKLNIPLRLQKNIELVLDKYKEKLEAKEIIASVLDSRTGEVLALASSNRFNPAHIKQDEVPYLNINAIEQTFEPGSVVKPIAISLVLNKGRASLDELIFAYNKSSKNKDGKYKKGAIKIGRWTIRDDHQFSKHYLTLSDIITYSSNIGTLQLAQRLKGSELLEGYRAFGLTKKTGIDLPYEKVGNMPTLKELSAFENSDRKNVFKATVSYGQGMRASFMQILKAYTVFNNNGYIVTPTIAQTTMKSKPIKVLSQRTANIMKKLLINVVQNGTGTKTKIDGLEIGGKTGTANMARGGRYKRRYMSSFFGFANDKKHRYTLGVTVREPVAFGKHWYYYYASNSAVPVFREIIKILVKFNYLKVQYQK